MNINDPINKPKHYNYRPVETWDILELMLEPDEFQGYLKGNIFKYLSRYTRKNNPHEDLQKLIAYAKRLLKYERGADVYNDLISGKYKNSTKDVTSKVDDRSIV